MLNCIAFSFISMIMNTAPVIDLLFMKPYCSLAFLICISSLSSRMLVNSFIVVFKRIIYSPVVLWASFFCPFLNMGMVILSWYSLDIFVSFTILLNGCNSFLASSGSPYFRSSFVSSRGFSVFLFLEFCFYQFHISLCFAFLQQFFKMLLPSLYWHSFSLHELLHLFFPVPNHLPQFHLSTIQQSTLLVNLAQCSLLIYFIFAFTLILTWTHSACIDFPVSKGFFRCCVDAFLIFLPTVFYLTFWF